MKRTIINVDPLVNDINDLINICNDLKLTYTQSPISNWMFEVMVPNDKLQEFYAVIRANYKTYEHQETL